VTTLRADRNDRHFVALGNRVAVFLAATASAHINEPVYGGLRGSAENPESFPAGAESGGEALPRDLFHVTPAAEPPYPVDLL
jgi:hypothetical protein